jgi:predicted ATPase
MINGRYIITGAPGTGKSSLLSELKMLGYNVKEEVSRQLIYEQQKINGSMLPWIDIDSFAAECYTRMLRDADSVNGAVTFFDRGIPDIQAYISFYKKTDSAAEAWENNNYSKTVFYCPLWEEIFVQDEQRPQTFNEAREIDLCLRRIYLSSGFALLELPKTDVHTRAQFILNSIKEKRQ